MSDTGEGKGNSTLKDSKVDQVDHAKEFTDEKMRMATTKSDMTRARIFA